MAHANNVGLNEISELGVPVLSYNRQINETDCCITMDPKHSKIPKFSFGIRRPNGEKKPSPSGASPVSRSKSMKVQRTNVPMVQKTKQSNSIDNGDEEFIEPRKTSLLQTPTSIKRDPSRSQPGSRSTTPNIDNSVGPFSRSMTVSSSNRTTPSNRPPQDMNAMKTHARSSSFSARERHNVTPGSIKRPTAIYSQTPDRKLQMKSSIPKSPPESSPPLRRTSSNSKTSSYEESDGSITSSYSKQSPGILRKPDSRKSSVGSQNGGRRPNSMISFTENASDLNELASEITQMGDSGVFGSAPPRVPSSRVNITPNRQGNSNGTVH